MKVLFTQDWHIKLDVPKIPNHWQVNRFHQLVDELNQVQDIDLLVIGGDLLDVANPSTDEVELMFALLAKLKHKTEVYSGNHEMATKKGGGKVSCLHNFQDEISRCNPNIEVSKSFRSMNYDIVGYEEISDKKLQYPAMSRLCFTHVRGEIAPHVKWEIDPSFFKDYDLVLTGDLHSHENTQGKFIYPGSPLTASFHRTRATGNGYIIIDTNTLSWEWHSLAHLPQLIRKTVTSTKEMVETEHDWTIYEVEANILDSKDIKKSKLLDKKIVTGFAKDAVLNLQGTSMSSEMLMFLTDVAKLPKQDIDRLIPRFNGYQRGYDENS